LEAEGFETVSITPARGFLRGFLSRIFRGLQTQTLRGRMGIAGALAINAAFARGEAISLGRGVTARLIARDIQYMVSQAAVTRLANTLGVGAAGVLSFGIQLYGDYGNPYLTPGQKVARAFTSGFLGGAATVGGLGIEILLVGSAGGPVGIIAAVPIAIILELWVAPRIFEAIGAVEQRNLAPLVIQN
jgi:hypothetical protein